MGPEGNESKTTHEIPFDDLEQLFEDTFQEVTENPPDKGEKKPKNTPQNTPFLSAKNEAFSSEEKTNEPKSKTPLRMKYELEVDKITQREGELEDIRRKLNLSKRKMAQLLMVDPSAWTRWTKKEGSAPPHIYRALEWYLLLQEKNPEYSSSLWLNAVARPQLSKHEILSIKNEILEGSQSELTKKAIFYLKEEDYKRNRLEAELEKKVQRIQKMKTGFYLLLVSQLLLAIMVIFLYL